MPTDSPNSQFSTLVHAAGGVVYRKVGNKIQVILVGSGNPPEWRLPKGIVESGEAFSETALREVREEAGVLAEIESEIGVAHWAYEYYGNLIQKATTYYLMNYIADSENRDQEHEYAEWVNLHDATGLLHFDAERSVIKKALKLLSANASRS